jgi:hypothetical protein
MEEIIRANLRMWSETISFSAMDDAIIHDRATLYDKGDKILNKSGGTTNLIADKNYVSTKDTKIYDAEQAVTWITNKISEVKQCTLYDLIISDKVQATIWIAIFAPSDFLKEARLEDISQQAKHSHIEFFLEDYTDLSNGGNPKKYQLGRAR